MRIGLAQIDCAVGNTTANVCTMKRMIREASAAGCSLVVFPEMSDTGYHLPTIVRTASTWHDEPYTELASAAASQRVNVIAGLSERTAEGIFNTLAVFGDDGRLIDKYRKLHLATVEPICEDQYLQAGDRIVTCPVGGFQIGLMTCYDIRFPELARRLALAGTEILVVPAAFPQQRIGHWRIINQCRAIENQAYLIGVNRIGNDEGMVFGGASAAWDPSGELLTEPQADEALLIVDVSRPRLAAVRSVLQVFRDRRTDLY